MPTNESPDQNTPPPRVPGWCVFPVSFVLALLFSTRAVAGPPGAESYITSIPGKGTFTLSKAGKSVPMIVSSGDHPGVLRVLKHLQADIGRVTGATPVIALDTIPALKEIVLIGSIDKSPLIQKMVQQKTLDVSGIAGRWETFLIQVVEHPLPGVGRALVIAGSDKRGTMYGMYDLSEAIGVSPWYWWADVPVRKQSSVYVQPVRHSRGEPKIKYRGIFINDEAPALSGWAGEKFGGFNSAFYEHVFELILRLKGNFLWPAMWGRAFYVDDPRNPLLADEFGVVIGTSHHEPMMRAHAEWAKFGTGPWNYEKNEEVLREFWREGIVRMGTNESIVTVGMRGDGDEPMTKEANVSLLQRIVRDQRAILRDVTGTSLTTIPQVWALYKEVQEYYDSGMRVDDDITLLLCDDNWGNIRKLPAPGDSTRAGGFGIYYHYDYVGGPRNYKWLNTNQISRVWEQMHLAYRYGATRIWIVNVGDIKPMEFPTTFFLDYAWNPDALPADSLPEYSRRWAARQFGPDHAGEIARLLTAYTTFNARRKPELLAPETYSLVNYREAESVVAAYDSVRAKARNIGKSLPTEFTDSYYQLVLHPIEACANLNELYVTAARNRLYWSQGRAGTNGLADRVRELFRRDSLITAYYNTVLANGKWHHMMDQTHIGYTSWQQPDENVIPAVRERDVPADADMGVAIEGSTRWWPHEKSQALLPVFDGVHQQVYYIEVFNRGTTPFACSIQPSEPWLRVSTRGVTIATEERLWVSVDWDSAPEGTHQAQITVRGPDGQLVVVNAVVNNPRLTREDLDGCFVEQNNYVAVEAEDFTRSVSSPPTLWQRIPDLGRTRSAMTPFPVTGPGWQPGGDAPRLEYRIYLYSPGPIRVRAYLSPTLNFHSTAGLRYGISFDDESPLIINMHEDKTFQHWEESVRNNVTEGVSNHTLSQPGRHVLKYWAVDPGVVLQRLVIETGAIQPSYLGPPESSRESGNNSRQK